MHFQHRREANRESESNPCPEIHLCQGLNSHYFHIIGDKLINPIVGVYIPIIRIPIKRWDDHPQKNATFDHGTFVFFCFASKRAENTG